MNNRVQELLAKIDAEVEAEVRATVTEKDAEIKAVAKNAYDASIENSISEIKKDVEAKYAMARKYLHDLETPAPAPAPIAAEPQKVSEGIIL